VVTDLGQTSQVVTLITWGVLGSTLLFAAAYTICEWRRRA